MGNTIIVTEQMIKDAEDSILYEKEKRFVEETAVLCFDKMQISGGANLEVVQLPPMYKENVFLKHRVLAAQFAKMLHIKFEHDESSEWIMSVYDFDVWNNSHVLNQMERLKGHVSAENRDKIFDILSTFRNIEKKLNAEVFGMLQVMNDPVTRILASIQASTTENNLKNATKKLNDAMQELENYKADKAVIKDENT